MELNPFNDYYILGEKEDLVSLYTYFSQAKADQVPIYEALSSEVQTVNAGTAAFYNRGEKIVGYLSEGETFEKRGDTSNGILVETSDETFGYMDRKKVEQVKKPIE